MKDSVIEPAPWVAYRTYSAPNGEVRSIISNLKKHTKVFLEDEAACFWRQIEKGTSKADLEALAADLGCRGESEEFLSELSQQGLIAASHEGDSGAFEKANPPPGVKSLELADNTNDEIEFQHWVIQQGFMYSTHWELTYRCNEVCVHCYNPGAKHVPGEKPHRKNTELDTRQVFHVIDRLVEGGVFELTLSGGEIMLRKDFFEIVAYARRKGCSVNIYTNGLKMTDAALGKLARLWPSSVGITIYSSDPAAHDEITKVKGSFERSTAALRALNTQGIRTSMKSMQMKHTVGGFRKTTNLAIELGATPEVDMSMSSSVDGAQAPLQLATEDPAQLSVLAASPGSPLFVGDASSNFGRVEKDMKSTPCAAGLSGLSLAADGSVYPCNSLPIPSGNAHEHDVLDIWQASLFKRRTSNMSQKAFAIQHPELDGVIDQLAAFQDIRLEDYEECGTHDRCSWCTKCSGMAMLETGSVLAPSTVNCRNATARMFAATLLEAGETSESIAEKLLVASNFGELPPGAMPAIQETLRGSADEFDPRAMNDLIASDRRVDMFQPLVLVTQRGEKWLRSGSAENVESLLKFEALRERFEPLQKTFR
jgi:AdoMet-dependent heme synthase